MQKVSHFLTFGLCLIGYLSTTFSSIALCQSKASGNYFNANLVKLLNDQLPSQRPNSLSVLVFDTSTGEEVFSFNSERPLKPASVQKVLSSLAALELLGPNFRFSTQVFSEVSQSNSGPSLYIRGSGDPGLTVETAWAMARGIRRRGIDRLSALHIDTSSFDQRVKPSGQRAYQAGSSALSFNYNSFSFEVCPSVPGKPATVVADPLELTVPMLGTIVTKKGSGNQLSIDQGTGGPKAKDGVVYKLSGSIGASQGCVTVYRSMRDPEKVFANTFMRMLKAVGVQTPESFSERTISGRAKLLYSHDSAPLAQIVRDLNHFSNNFIAEQILFALGLTEDGTFSRARGIQRLERFLRSMGYSEKEFAVHDASGLSHDNRLSARIIMALLRRGLENQGIAPEFESSLAVAQRSGTLRRRPVGEEGVIVRGKTGTLNGVSSLAGYVVGKSGRKYAFVILQNEVTSPDRAQALENNIVSILGRF